jgi:hypothetical protein
MANSIHTSQKGKVRRHKQKASQKGVAVKSAKYIQDFLIATNFTNGTNKLIDFLPLFHKYVKGDNLKYFAPQNFKKFTVKNGNIYWGKNEEVIFPVSLLFDEEKDFSEETLYVI